MGKVEGETAFLLFFCLLSWMNYFCVNKKYGVSESVVSLYSELSHDADTFS